MHHSCAEILCLHNKYSWVCKLFSGHHLSAMQSVTNELLWVRSVIVWSFVCFSVHVLPAECLPGKYGAGCSLDCLCQHNGTCDRFTGCCHCPEGFYGHSCEHSKWRRSGWLSQVWGFGVVKKHLTGSVKILGMFQITQLLPDLACLWCWLVQV